MEHYICYVEGTDGGKRFRHCSLDSAQIEAERLARLTGKKVHVYEWKGACQVISPPVIWDFGTRTSQYQYPTNGIKLGRLPLKDTDGWAWTR